MPWFFTALAIVFEVTATSLLTKTQGFSRLWPTVGVLLLYGFSFAFLAQAVKKLEVGLVYALWSGIGTAAIAAIGIIFYGESLSIPKLAGIALIVVGVLVLNLSGAHAQ